MTAEQALDPAELATAQGPKDGPDSIHATDTADGHRRHLAAEWHIQPPDDKERHNADGQVTGGGHGTVGVGQGFHHIGDDACPVDGGIERHSRPEIANGSALKQQPEH